MAYGERVRQARIHKGLTQVDLAAKIGATAAAVSRMEVIAKCQGSRFTCRIATACGVDPLWLETGTGQMITETIATMDPGPIVGLKIPDGLPDMVSAVGKVIRDALTRPRRTQAWLAEQCEVSEAAVSKWIRTGKISRENLSVVARALRIPVTSLLPNDTAPQAGQPIGCGSMVGSIASSAMSMKKESGRRLRGARIAAGFRTLDDLAAASGDRFSVSRLGNYEIGHRAMSPEVAKELAVLVRRSAAWLLCLDDDGLKPDEKALLSNYRAADDRGKSTISRIAETESPGYLTSPGEAGRQSA